MDVDVDDGSSCWCWDEEARGTLSEVALELVGFVAHGDEDEEEEEEESIAGVGGGPGRERREPWGDGGCLWLTSGFREAGGMQMWNLCLGLS